MSELVKVAALQMRSSTSLKGNIAEFEALVREAATRGATYVQSPEMTGALVRDRDSRSHYIRLEGRIVNDELIDIVMTEIRRLLEPI